jgi:hypothetical protein
MAMLFPTSCLTGDPPLHAASISGALRHTSVHQALNATLRASPPSHPRPGLEPTKIDLLRPCAGGRSSGAVEGVELEVELRDPAVACRSKATSPR